MKTYNCLVDESNRALAAQQHLVAAKLSELQAAIVTNNHDRINEIHSEATMLYEVFLDYFIDNSLLKQNPGVYSNDQN